MCKKTFLKVCAVITGVGFVLAGAGIAMGGAVHGIRLDAGGLHVYAPKIDEINGENHYESKEEQVEAFDSVTASVQYADLRIEPSDSDSYKLSYCLYGNRKLSVKREGSRLVLEQDTPAGYGGFNIAWFVIGSSQEGGRKQTQDEFITLYVPKGVKLSEIELLAEDGNISCNQVQAERVRIGAQYGNISLSGIQAQELWTQSESGRLQMEEVQAKNCEANSEYGDVIFDGLQLTEDLKIKAWNGNVRFRKAQMRSLMLDSRYGNIEGRQSVFTDMQVAAESGNCQMEEVLFDQCNIRIDDGNVELGLEKEMDAYSYELSAEYGDIQIGDKSVGDSYVSLEDQSRRMIQVACESGNIWVHEGH